MWKQWLASSSAVKLLDVPDSYMAILLCINKVFLFILFYYYDDLRSIEYLTANI